MHNKAKNSIAFKKAFYRDRYLFLMLIPVVAYYIIFHYIPMTGAIIAFKDFKPGSGIYGGDWVGFKWFKRFFGSPFAFRLVRNTFLIAFYQIIFGFPVPIIFAVCITQINKLRIRKSVQTVSYLPHFISTVVVVGILKNFLSLDGIINHLITKMGGETVNFLQSARYFRTIYVSSGIWQSFGFSSIIYIAAIVSIDPSLYESAQIDGISKFKEVMYITLPSISNTITLLLILRLGSIMSVGFEKVFLLYNESVFETGDVISTYVYRQGIQHSQYSFSAAVGFFNSIVNFTFVYFANLFARKVTQSSLW